MKQMKCLTKTLNNAYMKISFKKQKAKGMILDIAVKKKEKLVNILKPTRCYLYIRSW